MRFIDWLKAELRGQSHFDWKKYDETSVPREGRTSRRTKPAASRIAQDAEFDRRTSPEEWHRRALRLETLDFNMGEPNEARLFAVAVRQYDAAAPSVATPPSDDYDRIKAENDVQDAAEALGRLRSDATSGATQTAARHYMKLEAAALYNRVRASGRDLEDLSSGVAGFLEQNAGGAPAGELVRPAGEPVTRGPLGESIRALENGVLTPASVFTQAKLLLDGTLEGQKSGWDSLVPREATGRAIESALGALKHLAALSPEVESHQRVSAYLDEIAPAVVAELGGVDQVAAEVLGLLGPERVVRAAVEERRSPGGGGGSTTGQTDPGSGSTSGRRESGSERDDPGAPGGTSGSEATDSGSDDTGGASDNPGSEDTRSNGPGSEDSGANDSASGSDDANPGEDNSTSEDSGSSDSSSDTGEANDSDSEGSGANESGSEDGGAREHNSGSEDSGSNESGSEAPVSREVAEEAKDVEGLEEAEGSDNPEEEPQPQGAQPEDEAGDAAATDAEQASFEAGLRADVAWLQFGNPSESPAEWLEDAARGERESDLIRDYLRDGRWLDAEGPEDEFRRRMEFLSERGLPTVEYEPAAEATPEQTDEYWQAVREDEAEIAGEWPSPEGEDLELALDFAAEPDFSLEDWPRVSLEQWRGAYESGHPLPPVITEALVDAGLISPDPTGPRPDGPINIIGPAGAAGESEVDDEDGGSGSGSGDSGAGDSGSEDAGGDTSGSADSSTHDSGSEDSAGDNTSGSDDSGANDSGSDDSGSGSDDSGANESGSGSDESSSEDSGSDDSGSNSGSQDPGEAEGSGSDDSGANDSGSDDSGSGSDDSGANESGSGSDESSSEDSGSNESSSEETGSGSDDSGANDSGSDDTGSGSDNSGSDDSGPRDSGSDDSGSNESGSEDSGDANESATDSPTDATDEQASKDAPVAEDVEEPDHEVEVDGQDVDKTEDADKADQPQDDTEADSTPQSVAEELAVREATVTPVDERPEADAEAEKSETQPETQVESTEEEEQVEADKTEAETEAASTEAEATNAEGATREETANADETETEVETPDTVETPAEGGPDDPESPLFRAYSGLREVLTSSPLFIDADVEAGSDELISQENTSEPIAEVLDAGDEEDVAARRPQADETEVETDDTEAEADENEVETPEDKAEADETEVELPDDKAEADETEVETPEDKAEADETEVETPEDKAEADETEVETAAADGDTEPGPEDSGPAQPLRRQWAITVTVDVAEVPSAAQEAEREDELVDDDEPERGDEVEDEERVEDDEEVVRDDTVEDDEEVVRDDDEVELEDDGLEDDDM
jgi:hypothetical protein